LGKLPENLKKKKKLDNARKSEVIQLRRRATILKKCDKRGRRKAEKKNVFREAAQQL